MHEIPPLIIGCKRCRELYQNAEAHASATKEPIA
jgi:hypothetical protein